VGRVNVGKRLLQKKVNVEGKVLWRNGNVLSSPHETEFKNRLSVSSCGKSKVSTYVECGEIDLMQSMRRMNLMQGFSA
jgi:hypothetical protein